MSLTDRFITFSLLRKIVLLFSRAFFILQVLFILGNDLGKLGYLFAIGFFLEAVSDYPSGVMSDKIGYRKILFLAYTVYGVSYYILSVATDLKYLIAVFALQSLGNGLDSGGLQSWFDSNYAEISSGVDPDRKIYSQIFARISSSNDLIGLGMAIIGGYIAANVDGGRQLAFQIQSGMMFLLAIIFALGVKSYYVSVKDDKKKDNFIVLLLKGIWFVLTNPRIFVLSIGLVIDIIVKSIWLALIMIPLYYLYTGNEFYISLLNFAMFAVTSLYLTRQAKSWTRLNPRKWLPFVFILQGLIFYGGLYYLVVEYHGSNTFSLIGVTVLFVVGSISTILLTLIKIFTYRLLLDSIPNDKRNAYYSLLPTLSMLVASVLNFYAGAYIQNNGFDLALLGLIAMRFVGAFFVFVAIIVFGLAKDQNIRLYDQNIPLIFESSLDTLQSTFREFKPTDWYLGETSKIVWMNLLEVARNDGKVTNEELDLLTSIMASMRGYFDLLEKVYEDQVISEEETTQLINSRAEVLELAKQEAMKDEKLSSDEKNILEKLERILIELEKVENIGKKN